MNAYNYDPKTVAEQSAFEFGKSLIPFGLSDNLSDIIGRRYAFAHQYSAFPRSDTGFDRLITAFRAGLKAEQTLGELLGPF